MTGPAVAYRGRCDRGWIVHGLAHPVQSENVCLPAGRLPERVPRWKSIREAIGSLPARTDGW